MVASVGGGGPGGFGGLTATGLAAGSTTITASYTSGGTTFTAPATLTVQQPTTAVGLHLTPASASVYVGGTQQFTAYTENSDGTTTDVTTNSGTSWTTSDGTLATITTGANRGRRFWWDHLRRWRRRSSHRRGSRQRDHHGNLHPGQRLRRFRHRDPDRENP